MASAAAAGTTTFVIETQRRARGDEKAERGHKAAVEATVSMHDALAPSPSSAVVIQAPHELPGLPPTNGRMALRHLAAGSAAFAVLLSIVACIMALKVEDSATLWGFTSFFVLFGAAGVYDAVLIFRGTPDSHVFLSWDWHHAGTKRIAGLFHVVLLGLFPVLVTFLFNSLGQGFFSTVSDMSSSDRRDYTYHLITYLTTVFFVLAQLAFARFTMKKLHMYDGVTTNIGPALGSQDGTRALERSDCQEDLPIYFSRRSSVASPVPSMGRLPSDGLPPRGSRIASMPSSLVSDARGTARYSRKYVCMSKMLALFSSAATTCFLVSLVRTSVNHPNSGVITCTVLSLLLGITTMLDNLRWLIRSESRSAQFVSRSRNLIAVWAVVSYFSFWTVLLLLVLLKWTGDGFWNTLDHLPSSRRATVYSFIAIWLVFSVLAAARIPVHKFRRHLRRGHAWQGASVLLERAWNSVFAADKERRRDSAWIPATDLEQNRNKRKSITATARKIQVAPMPNFNANGAAPRGGGSAPPAAYESEPATANSALPIVPQMLADDEDVEL